MVTWSFFSIHLNVFAFIHYGVDYLSNTRAFDYLFSTCAFRTLLLTQGCSYLLIRISCSVPQYKIQFDIGRFGFSQVFLSFMHVFQIIVQWVQIFLKQRWPTSLCELAVCILTNLCNVESLFKVDRWGDASWEYMNCIKDLFEEFPRFIVSDNNTKARTETLLVTILSNTDINVTENLKTKCTLFIYDMRE